MALIQRFTGHDRNWNKRFERDRLAGLFARHNGRERYIKVTDRIEAPVLARTTKHKPC